LLAGLDEAELLLPLGAVDVRQVLRAAGVVAQADVCLVDALVDAADGFLQVQVGELEEAVGVVGTRLAVVGSLDLAGARVLADLEDLEVVQLVHDLASAAASISKVSSMVAGYAACPRASCVWAVFSWAALIISSVRPEERRMVVVVFCPVSTSAAVTCTMPLVSISNVTSMRTSPR